MVKTNYFNKFRRKGKGKAKAKKVQRPPRMTFAKRVNQIIARNVENKYTATILYKAPVSIISSNGNAGGGSSVNPVETFHAYSWSPGYSGGTGSMFNISQGTSVQERIGNKIKIKKWIIKGVIQPNDTFNTSPAPIGNAVVNPSPGIAPNTMVGYVDVYFGRYQQNVAPVGGGLTNFYQSGATDITPIGQQVEMLYRVNKDLYKVYYHKRFKVGTGQMNNGTTLIDGSGTFPGANGFGMAKTFGFDVCKYICKNKVLVFDELVSTPQSADIENLTIWAIFHPSAGDMGYIPAQAQTPTSGNTVNTSNSSFYNLSCMSYAEYEDA